MGVMVLVTITTKSKDEQRIAKEHSLFSQATAMRCATRAWPDVLRRSVTCRRGGAAAMYMSPNCLKDLPDHVSTVQGVHRRYFSSMQGSFVYVLSFSGTPALTSTSLSSMLKRGSHCETSARGTMPLAPDTSAPGSSRQLRAWSLNG